MSPAPPPTEPPRVVDRAPLRETVRRLSRVDTGRSLRAVAAEWGMVAAAAGAAVWSGHPLAWVLAGAFIATRQHAMLVLMHDGAHHRLIATRRWNDAASDLLLALPNNVLTRRYRVRHHLHHRHTNHPLLDPDRQTIARDDQWWFPRSRGSAALVFARDVLGLNAGRMMAVMTHYSPWPAVLAHLHSPDADRADATVASREETVRVLAFTAVLAAVLTLTGAWLHYLALWVLPSMTVLPALLRLRGIAEHEGDVGHDEVSVSRHVDAGWLESFVLAPRHIRYHVAHHLFPSVPWYNLPELHSRLMQQPEYAARLVTRPSYTGPGGVLDHLTEAHASDSVAETPPGLSPECRAA